MNRKGFIDLSGIGLMSLGVPASGFICVAAVLIVISQMPSVKRDFREKKAIKMCTEQGYFNCKEAVKEMSKEQLLDYIRDDKVWGNGGYMTMAEIK